jgi:hypothetical protein
MGGLQAVNLLKGAAPNAVPIAECVVARPTGVGSLIDQDRKDSAPRLRSAIGYDRVMIG